MTLRERLAICICGADEYTLPALRREPDGSFSPPSGIDDPLVVMPTRCVCARDQRTPVMTTARCANCLSKADAVLNLLETAGIITPAHRGFGQS